MRYCSILFNFCKPQAFTLSAIHGRIVRQIDVYKRQVQEVCQHPNADKLKVCRTDIGGGDIREIVCGGANLRDGMKVAVACPGAMCRWHGEGEPVEIKETKLRGVASYGMICASSEIGLADLFPAEEAVILDLSDFDAPAGTPLSTALGMDDILLEIDNKSMTNRPDLWGHYGIARELAALYHLPLKPFKHFDRNVENTSGFHVTVLDEERCPRMTGTQIEGLYVKPAPYWMQSRIWKVGMRPINALVDVTNYVKMCIRDRGRPLLCAESPMCVGSFAFPIWEVIAAAMTVGLCRLPVSFCTISTGRTPPCSLPTTGLRLSLIHILFLLLSLS